MARAHADFRPISEKSLNELEGVNPSPPEFESFLTSRVYQLRQKPVGEFSVEDLRLMLGQKIAVLYLVPFALAHLEQNPLVGGDFYPGDLLVALLAAEPWWRSRADILHSVQVVLRDALARLEQPVGRTSPDDLDEAVLALHRRQLADDFRAALAKLA
jgi:hypothetical protein